MRKERAINQLSDSEKRVLCKRWQASKLSLALFCKEQGVAKSTFYSWNKRFTLDDKAKDSPSHFVCLSPPLPPLSEQEKIALELKLKNGTLLTLILSLKAAIELIRELSDATSAIRQTDLVV